MKTQVGRLSKIKWDRNSLVEATQEFIPSIHTYWNEMNTLRKYRNFMESQFDFLLTES
jgi:hypothetical protein